MNPFDDGGTGAKAVLEYGDGEFFVVKPGSHVICAVTGAAIPLESLRYWSVDKQEPYADAAAAMKGFGYGDGE